MELRNSVSQCKEGWMRVKTSGLGRSIKDYLWYLATLEWKFFIFCFATHLILVPGLSLFLFFYLNTSSICRFTATLELENCLRIKNDYFDDCSANAVRCNLFWLSRMMRTIMVEIKHEHYSYFHSWFYPDWLSGVSINPENLISSWPSL